MCNSLRKILAPHQHFRVIHLKFILSSIILTPYIFVGLFLSKCYLFIVNKRRNEIAGFKAFCLSVYMQE